MIRLFFYGHTHVNINTNTHNENLPSPKRHLNPLNSIDKNVSKIVTTETKP